jgi:hypothetical protein
MMRLIAHVLCRCFELGIALSAIACACSLARVLEL